MAPYSPQNLCALWLILGLINIMTNKVKIATRKCLSHFPQTKLRDCCSDHGSACAPH